MNFRIIATISAVLFTVGAAAQTKQAGSKSKPEMEPITIDLGDNPPPRSTATPAAARSAKATATPTSGNAATAKLGAQVSEMFESKMERLKPALTSWKSAAAQIKASGELTPDFSSERDIAARIAVYQRVRDETQSVLDAIEQNFSRFETDLQAAGVPAEHAKTGAAVMLKDVQALTKKMKAADSMCATAIQSLNLLQKQWGNWKYAGGTIDYDIDFPMEEKVRYSSLVQKYRQESTTVQQLGGL